MVWLSQGIINACSKLTIGNQANDISYIVGTSYRDDMEYQKTRPSETNHIKLI